MHATVEQNALRVQKDAVQSAQEEAMRRAALYSEMEVINDRFGLNTVF